MTRDKNIDKVYIRRIKKKGKKVMVQNSTPTRESKRQAQPPQIRNDPAKLRLRHKRMQRAPERAKSGHSLRPSPDAELFMSRT